MALCRIIAAAVLTAALAAPATAGAAQGRRGAAPRVQAASLVSTAAAVGERYWGAVPCNDQIQVVARQSVPAALAPDSDAWVTFDSSLGANDLAAPAGSYTNCVIGFARWRWPTSATMRADWGMFCATMTHELGHLLGRPHDDTRGSVMTTVFTDRSSVPQSCRASRPGRTARST